MELEISGNPLNCRSLCWLKYEVEHRTVKSKFIYTCAEGQEWALLKCGVSGVWFLYKSQRPSKHIFYIELRLPINICILCVHSLVILLHSVVFLPHMLSQGPVQSQEESIM